MRSLRYIFGFVMLALGVRIRRISRKVNGVYRAVRNMHSDLTLPSQDQSPKKYRITRKRHPKEPALYRIQALIDIPQFGIWAGDYGGYVSSESNLSQDGDCFILDDAIVSGGAHVSGQALVRNNARILEQATVMDFAIVGGTAGVCGFARIADGAHVYGDTVILGKAIVKGRASVYGEALVSGNSNVSGLTEVFEKAHILNSTLNGHAKVYGKATVRGGSYVTDRAQIRGVSDFHKSHAYNESLVEGHCCLLDVTLYKSAHVSGRAKIVASTLTDHVHVSSKATVAHSRVEGNSVVQYDLSPGQTHDLILADNIMEWDHKCVRALGEYPSWVFHWHYALRKTGLYSVAYSSEQAIVHGADLTLYDLFEALKIPSSRMLEMQAGVFVISLRDLEVVSRQQGWMTRRDLEKHKFTASGNEA